VTVLNQGSNRPAFTEGSRPYWALPSPMYERSGYRASRPTGYKVMRSSCIVIIGPALASCLARHRNRMRCRRPILAPSSLRSRPLTRRLRRWPTANLDRTLPRRQRPPPTNNALLTTHSPYKVQPRHPGLPCAVVYGLLRALPGEPTGEPGFLGTVIRMMLDAHHRKLSASVGAPEPHDFAVRDSCRSSVSANASTASWPTFRDDRP
jgi:hypothetical protein